MDPYEFLKKKGENMSKDYEMKMETLFNLSPGSRFARAHSFDEFRTLNVFEDSRGIIEIKGYFYRDNVLDANGIRLSPEATEWLFKTLKEYYEPKEKKK